jgi:hypothetical protein
MLGSWNSIAECDGRVGGQQAASQAVVPEKNGIDRCGRTDTDDVLE